MAGRSIILKLKLTQPQIYLNACVQGFHSGGVPIAMLGLAKGLVGLAFRPTFGLLEMTAKGTYGMGLVCLGREAISGSTLRRVRAPGALAEDYTEVSGSQIQRR